MRLPITIDRTLYRAVGLVKESEDGRSLTAELLRPLTWLEKRGVKKVGDWISLQISEMGAIGRFQVMAIEDCPEIRPGRGEW